MHLQAEAGYEGKERQVRRLEMASTNGGKMEGRPEYDVNRIIKSVKTELRLAILRSCSSILNPFCYGGTPSSQADMANLHDQESARGEAYWTTPTAPGWRSHELGELVAEYGHEEDFSPYRAKQSFPSRNLVPDYKPASLRWPFLSILLTAIAGLIALTEYACRSLPTENNYTGPPTEDRAAVLQTTVWPTLGKRSLSNESQPVSP